MPHRLVTRVFPSASSLVSPSGLGEDARVAPHFGRLVAAIVSGRLTFAHLDLRRRGVESPTASC